MILAYLWALACSLTPHRRRRARDARPAEHTARPAPLPDELPHALDRDLDAMRQRMRPLYDQEVDR